MPTIQLEKDLSSLIAAKATEIKHCPRNQIIDFLQEDSSFRHIVHASKKLLEKSLFVIIKNIGFVREKTIFEAFIRQFGSLHGLIEYTDIKLDCPYTGGRFEALELHNDDAIDIQNQPLYTFIQVQNEDPLQATKNTLVRIDHLVRYLQSNDKNFLDELLSTNVKMLSYGVNYEQKSGQEIITNEPILYKRDDTYFVRFDLSRIQHYAWKKSSPQCQEEIRLIDKFLRISKKLQTEFYLDKGDILILNNKRTLHARGECNLQLNADGSFRTREIQVGFVQDGSAR